MRRMIDYFGFITVCEKEGWLDVCEDVKRCVFERVLVYEFNGTNMTDAKLRELSDIIYQYTRFIFDLTCDETAIKFITDTLLNKCIYTEEV